MTVVTTTMLNRKRYSPGGPGEDLYFSAMDKLMPRLRRKGQIKTAEAWKIVGGSYSLCATIFFNIMEKMISDGTAVKQGKGQYFITRDEVIFEPPSSERPEAKIITRIKEGVAPWYSKVYGCWMTPCKANEQ